MRKISKRILSFILTLVMILTMGLSGVVLESAKAADSGSTVQFTYRYGANNLIQFNTDLPTDTPCGDFISTQNGCAIQEEGKSVGWVGMTIPENESQIVLTFNFNDVFEAGQTYTLKQGSKFGFKNGSVYQLDKNYTLTFDGTNWSVKTQYSDVQFTYRYGANNLIQFNTDLPTDTPCGDFISTQNGCAIQEEGKSVGWVGMTIPENESQIVLTFNFNDVFEAGQTYTLKQGSKFGFTNGLVYQLDKTYTFTFDGANWETLITQEHITVAYRHGTSNLIQVNTNLPSDTPIKNFTTGENGCNIDQSGNQYQQVGWIGMDNADGTIVLTFHFNKAFEEGQTYVLKQGSEFGFTNGLAYTLDKDYTFTLDGANWSMKSEYAELTFAYQEGGEKEIKVITNLPQNTTLKNFLTGDNQCEISQESPQPIGWIGMSTVTVDETNKIALAFNFNAPFTAGQRFILNTGSVFGFNGGHDKYVLKKDYVFTFDGNAWRMSHNKQALQGDTNNDDKVDSVDLVRMKKAQASIYEYAECYDIVADSIIDEWDVKRERYILIGASWESYTNSAEYLLAESNFNGGDEFVTFADRPADPTDPAKIQEYKDAGFNTATVTGEYSRRENGNATAYYVRMTTEDASGIDTNDKMVLTLTLNSGESATSETGGHIQLETNIPQLQNNSGYDFILGDEHSIIWEKSEYAPAVGWCGLRKIDGIVYWTLNYNQGEVFKYQDTYTLKAGSELYIDGTTYVLDKTYKFEYTNDYRVSIENLDEAGLNVWIRNTSNKTNYFTDDILNLIQPYTDVIDGIYMGDEPFSTPDIRTSSYKFTTSKNDLELMTFSELCSLNLWFNDKLQDKYFFVNHVGMPGYNHYMESPLKKAPTVSAYAKYYEDYNTSVLSGITSSTKKPLSFDLYPLGYDKREVKYSSNVGESVWQPTKWQSQGIDPYYLVTMLTVANKAKEQGNIFSYYIQAQTNKTQLKTGKSRALISSDEISMQLYAGMACGAKMYGYYLYNALNTEPENGMIDATGNKTNLYGFVQSANKEALPFADVLQTFTWEGAEFVTGSISNNSEALSLVTSNSSLNLMLDDATDGVLTNASTANPTNDILVGYYKKGGQDAYMIANYNDPRYVTNKNNVTLKFDGCNYARVYTGDVEKGLTSKIEPLDADGSYKFTLQPGGGCFVIPVYAAS